jgi:hypothetical protein
MIMEPFFCSYLTLFIAAERLFAATHRGLCRRNTHSTNISTV